MNWMKMCLLRQDSTRQNTPPYYALARTGLGTDPVKYRIISPTHLRMPLLSDFHELLTMLYRIENLECQTWAFL